MGVPARKRTQSTRCLALRHWRRSIPFPPADQDRLRRIFLIRAWRLLADLGDVRRKYILVHRRHGLKFSFSSDTFPNKWWLEHTKDSDIAIHECFLPPSLLVKRQKFPVANALNVGTQVHTSPALFGKVMSIVKPRLAVGYHFFNDFDTAPEVERLVGIGFLGLEEENPDRMGKAHAGIAPGKLRVHVDNPLKHVARGNDPLHVVGRHDEYQGLTMQSELLLIAAASLAVAGHNAGLKGTMNRRRMNAFALVLAALMLIVRDFDRPMAGTIRINNHSLNALIADMENDLNREP